MLQVQKKYNTASVIISHDMNCIRITANRVIMLIEGRCYANKPFPDLQASQDPKIKEFFE
jgi:phospholipid/cholesterol/gamma-HCH transport system ATP-binding protein